ncbi:mediator of RNA polymerase II transcription subunit 15-like isoform X2 [Centruroides vittatus]|uniref:mediator of RNA polymerase II transcription subunit 15-like isoform X2 n=1 Tax=Centruroides vittatus TaxID=120091 RepID=UPI00350F8C71
MGGFNENMSFVQTQQTSPATSQYQSTTQFQGQSPGPVVTNQGPGSNQSTVPSPVPQHGTNVSNSQMAPSPAGYAPSPTSQIAPSPVGYSGRAPTNAGAPSPGSALNTPGNIGASPSPAGRTLQDDQMYLEKLKQLSKYIEPLRRMIARLDKDEERKKELSKMKHLLDILSDPNKRCSMDILLKCEQVLERLEFKVTASESSVATSNQSIVGPSKPPEQNICQPLIDAINYHIKSPLFNHTLQRTFGPAVAALNGPRTVIPSPLSKKRKHEEDNSEISNVLQGEIARLDQRFKIQLDPVQHQGSRTVHLICQLDDKNLPCVPPITIAVPENYPEKPPHCNTTKEEYDSTPFLQCIQKVLSSQLSNMPGKFSVTSLLDAWEMSVRQACSPKPSTMKECF